MVLADDVNSDGYLDLIISTLSGNVYAYQTSTPVEPLKMWPERFHSLNGRTARENHVGITISPQSRVSHDVKGDFFKLAITIHDDRLWTMNQYFVQFFNKNLVNFAQFIWSR